MKKKKKLFPIHAFMRLSTQSYLVVIIQPLIARKLLEHASTTPLSIHPVLRNLML